MLLTPEDLDRLWLPWSDRSIQRLWKESSSLMESVRDTPCRSVGGLGLQNYCKAGACTEELVGKMFADPFAYEGLLSARDDN